MIQAMESWEDIFSIFSRADEVIKALELDDDPEVTMARGHYARAEVAWAKYDYDTTKENLEKILETIQE
jgi:hypothetical protein